MSDLTALVERLEKVGASLAKKQTLPLRTEQSLLMRQIQSIRQQQRLDATAPLLEEGSSVNVTPDTVSGGTGLNGA